MPSHSTILMPGEHLRIELPTDITPEAFKQKISGLLKGVKYELEFANQNIALVSFQTADAKHVEIRLTDSDIPSLALEIVPQKRLLVLSTNGHTLSSLDVPISTAGAISMSKDYSTVRLVRPVYTNWTYVPLREYQWNIKTGAVVPESKGILYPQSYEYNTFDDWANTVDAVNSWSETLGLAAGISHDQTKLAFYSSGEISILDLSTRQIKRYPIQSVEADGHDPLPDRVFWSMDNTKVFYSAAPSPTQTEVLTVHALDLRSGTETRLAEGHFLRSTSPFSPHLFTSCADGLFIVDYEGKQVKLGGPNDKVTVAKWINSKRALVNKGTENTCYIYYLEENRWHYVSDGYGFDYDVDTHRVLVLQKR